jgi:hypothetical protein
LLVLPLALFVPFAEPLVGGGEACRQAATARSFDYEQELFFAVLEGLYVDGVSNEAVDAILAEDPVSGRPANFVWACPICMPAYEALRVYRARPAFVTKKLVVDTFGPGIDPAVLARLTRGDLASRQSAIMELVQSWTARRLDSMRLTDAERDGWRLEMEMRRKKGMEMLYSYRDGPNAGSYAQMKACPFCDAANEACGRR